MLVCCRFRHRLLVDWLTKLICCLGLKDRMSLVFTTSRFNPSHLINHSTESTTQQGLCRWFHISNIRTSKEKNFQIQPADQLIILDHNQKSLRNEGLNHVAWDKQFKSIIIQSTNLSIIKASYPRHPKFILISTGYPNILIVYRLENIGKIDENFGRLKFFCFHLRVCILAILHIAYVYQNPEITF